MSGLVNKVKEALSSDKSHEAPQGATGPHGSKVANTVDPRVDSDRDHRANPATGTNVGGYQDPNTTHSSTHGHTTGTTGTRHNDVTGFDDPTGTHGPHGSRVANAADPRVDSDRDHRSTGGLGGSTTHTGAGTIGSTGHGHTGTTGHNDFAGNTGHSGLAGNTGHTGYDGTGSGIGHSNVTTGYNDPVGTHGTHGSRVANAADPRIDSDRDHRGAGGLGGSTAHTGATHTGAGPIGSTGHGHTGYDGTTSHTGNTGAGTGSGFGNSNVTTGYNDPVGTHGTHGSRVANAADPRIDSDRDHRGAPGTTGTLHAGSGPGPAANTAGPHKSDALNKVDPRVDSDLDGSKTVGGNKTYQHTGASTAHKDPTDAAQVPPSVLADTIGGPHIEHGDHTHGREGRHGSISHQEAHRGI